MTKKQLEVFKFIEKYISINGFSPSYEEIAESMNFKSLSSVTHFIEKLVEMGSLEFIPGKARSLKLPLKNPGFELLSGGEIFPINIEESLLSASDRIEIKVKTDDFIDFGIKFGDSFKIVSSNTLKNNNLYIYFEKNYSYLFRTTEDFDTTHLIELKSGQVKLLLEEKNTHYFQIISHTINKEEYSEIFKIKKNEYLKSILSKSTNSKQKYKRVSLSTIRYAGGKTQAVGYVIELLPDDVKKVVSPFFGGGSIEIALSKILGLEVIGYDIFDILTNYWYYQINYPELLYNELKKLNPDKETFERIRLILNDVWKKNITLEPLTLAVYYVYNFNLSYGPGFMGWSSSIYLNQNKYNRMLDRIKNFNPGNLKVFQGDFKDVLLKHKDDFLYLDPPYYIGPDSKMFKGIYPMRNIPVHHNGFKHELLRDLLKDHRGGFILSYNDCETIRDYYKDFEQHFPTWQYTMGQGETRIGKNRMENDSDHIKDSHEIMIYGPRKI